MWNKLKNLVVNDYFTPNIKAEVTLDTLLTPYIEGIVNSQCGLNAAFVTKEMSVSDSRQSDPAYGNRGTKIDYILADAETVYLVELKTTEGSIGHEQAERYLNNCRGDGKTFGRVFGNKLLEIMSDKTGEALKDAKEPEEQLKELFNDILKKYAPNAEGESCGDQRKKGELYAGQAKKLLRQRNWASTYKYLYTMGQLLDYIYPNPNEKRALWNLPLKLIYITPYGKLPHPELENYQNFYLYAKTAKKKSVSLQAAVEYLGRQDELAQALSDIIKEIYGEMPIH